ncbi:MAG TPA: Holliday junction resolvase RuvX [Gemmatimonadales bacterium]|nr:Holliday junction resolvase RuvX [Usitatibacter sp.]
MPAGTVLAFDYGVKRIGVAVGETALGIASPLGAIREESNSARFAQIARLVSEWRPAAFVVGRPRHSDGSAHEVARLAEKFARRLTARHRIPVVFVDETLSSAAAEQALREARTRARRAGDVDAMAAAIILQSYLDDPAGHERLPS